MIGSHRVLIASLFLPSAVEFDPIPESPASSLGAFSPISEEQAAPPELALPEQLAPQQPSPAAAAQQESAPHQTEGAAAPGGRKPPPRGLSIISDLQSKASTPLPTPRGQPVEQAQANPFFPSFLPGASVPPPASSRTPEGPSSPPAHDERDVNLTITAEGAAKPPGRPKAGPLGGMRGLPSEMALPKSTSSSNASSGTSTPKSTAAPSNSPLNGAGTKAKESGSILPPAAGLASLGRPVLRTAKSSGSGPGGRFPAGHGFSDSSHTISSPLSTSTLPPSATGPSTSSGSSAVDPTSAPPSPVIPYAQTPYHSHHSRQLSASSSSGRFPHHGQQPAPPASPSQAAGLSLGGGESHALSRTTSTSRSSSRRRSSSHQSGAPGLSGVTGAAEQHVPFHLAHNPQGNIGLQNALHAIQSETKEQVWIGALGNRTDGVPAPVRSSIEDKLWREQRSKAVWLQDEVFEGHYDVFCKQILWPTFHYSTVRKDETTNWEDYVAVNQAFADTIVDTYEEGDIIFVNDYHLLLVPAMVRDRLPKSIIGFFLHIAFPSSEIFRCLAMREQLLQGMLGANLVGFQTYNFSRHFRQTVSRVLQHVEATPKGIQLSSSFVDVEVFGIGIDVETLEERRLDPEVEQWATLLRERYGETKVIVARDKLDEVKGLKHKLLSFERFLQVYPEWQGKVVLIQVALATTERNEAQENVSDIVTRINSRFSNLTYQPVVFLHTEPPTFSQYLGLMTVADAFIATSLREGMNLTAHEYVKCQAVKHRPMILSEFTGSYSYSTFRACLPVNPYDYGQVAESIHTALTMSDDEATTRWKELDAHVSSHTAQAWARKYLKHLELAHSNQRSRRPDEIPQLEVAQIEPAFKKAARRLLVLDLEGTLWSEDPFTTHQNGFHPPKSLLDLLEAVTADDGTTVYLLSGKGTKDLDQIARAVPRLGIVAEHGCFVMPAGEGLAGAEKKWISTIENLDMAWRGPCLEILSYFSERTPGSYVEDRGTSLVWRFSQSTLVGSSSKGDFEADEEENTHDHTWAKRQAAEAQNHVSDVLCERYKLQIYPGRDSFLVLPRQSCRSNAVAAILKHQNSTSPPSAEDHFRVLPKVLDSTIQPSYDFVVAITSDERLISALNALKAGQPGPTRSINVYTITSGAKPSQASWACESGRACEVLAGLVGGAAARICEGAK